MEDHPGDARLTTKAPQGGHIPPRVGVTEDGSEAISYLGQEGEYADGPRLDLAPLDLNMPRMNRHEVLVEIRGNPELKCVPVVIFSISGGAEDLILAYNNHASSFISERLRRGGLERPWKPEGGSGSGSRAAAGGMNGNES